MNTNFAETNQHMHDSHNLLLGIIGGVLGYCSQFIPFISGLHLQIPNTLMFAEPIVGPAIKGAILAAAGILGAKGTGDLYELAKRQIRRRCRDRKRNNKTQN